MRSLTCRMTSTLTAGILATAMFAGAVTVPTAVAKGTKDSSGSTDSSLSAELGSSEFQKIYDEQDEWGRIFLTLIAGGAILELIGFILGPARHIAEGLFPRR